MSYGRVGADVVKGKFFAEHWARSFFFVFVFYLSALPQSALACTGPPFWGQIVSPMERATENKDRLSGLWPGVVLCYCR